MQVHQAGMKMQNNEPQYLYKYRIFPTCSKEMEYLERIFTHSILYLAPPKSLNDPFDCDPVIDPQCEEEHVESFILEMLEKTEGIKEEQERLRRMKVIKKWHYTNGAVKPELLNQLAADIKKQWSEDIGVLCLTAEPDDVLMWSHYAGGH